MDPVYRERYIQEKTLLKWCNSKKFGIITYQNVRQGLNQPMFDGMLIFFNGVPKKRQGYSSYNYFPMVYLPIHAWLYVFMGLII